MPWTFYNASGQKLSSAATNISVLDIDGATDIGEALIAADLFIVDNGANGTNRKIAASGIATYIGHPVFGRVARTAASVTNTSTSHADFTGASITFTTGAFPIAYGVVQTANNSGANGEVRFNIDIDGALQLGAIGVFFEVTDASDNTNASFAGQSAALSAASHTVKLRWSVNANTGTVHADSNYTHIFWAHEIR